VQQQCMSYGREVDETLTLDTRESYDYVPFRLMVARVRHAV
jgi:hypothetical protein